MAKKLPTLLDGIDGYPEPARTFVEAIAAEFPEIARLPLVHFDEFPGVVVTTCTFEIDNMTLHSTENGEDPIREHATNFAVDLRNKFKEQYGDPETYTRLAQFKSLQAYSKGDPAGSFTTISFQWGVKPIIDVPKED